CVKACCVFECDPHDVARPGITDPPPLTLQPPRDGRLRQRGGFHQCPPPRGELLPTLPATQPLDLLVLTGPRAGDDVARPSLAPSGTARIGTGEWALVMIRWRQRWLMHRIVLPLLRESDSANFPSDFTRPVVIFLLDYRNFFARALLLPEKGVRFHTT